MLTVLDLWLPIIASAAAVFVASALAWMLMPHHKGDWKKLPNEDAFIASVRSLSIAPGMYGFPDMTNADCKDPQVKEKFTSGPCGVINVWPPNAFTSMGPKMVASFVIYLVVSVFVAYLASRALPGAGAGAAADGSFMDIFQIAGTAGIMAYCFARLPNDIWFNTPGRAIVTNLIDGIVYGLITGAIFGWLWPA